MRAVDASIVICTYGRAASLDRALASVAIQDAGGLAIEVVVVDNNSPDATAAVVDRWSRRAPFPVRYVFEAQQGLSAARNAGVAAARGAIVAFTDDDVTVAPDWITALVAGMAATQADAIGGRIRPIWPGPVPSWLTFDLWAFLALLDHGDTPIVLDAPALFGANFAVRRAWLRRFSFDTRLGRNGATLGSSEESAFLDRILQHGGRVVYWPGALVHHHINADRLTKRYFRRWHVDLGDMQGRLGPWESRRHLFGVPYHIVRGLVREGAGCCRRLLRPEARFRHELNLRRLVGFARARFGAHLRIRLTTWRAVRAGPESDRPPQAAATRDSSRL